MTLQTTLAEIGHILLWVFAFLLIAVVVLLAAAFLLTLLLRLDVDVSVRKDGTKLKQKISVFLLLFKFNIYKFETDDMTGSEKENKTEDIPEDLSAENDSSSGNVYTLSFDADGKINLKINKSKKFGENYEIIIVPPSEIVETAETEPDWTEQKTESEKLGSDIEEPKVCVEEWMVETEKREEETEFLNGSGRFFDESMPIDERKTDIRIENILDESENFEICDETNREKPVEEIGNNIHEDEEIKNDSNKDEEFDSDEDGIEKYVDLSDPVQFATDSITAGIKMIQPTTRFVSSILLKMKIRKMSLDLVYGLADPADTAVSSGVLYSFKSSMIAYLEDIKNRTKNKNVQKNADILIRDIEENVLIHPVLTEKAFRLDSDLAFSFWVRSLYIPTLKFLFHKNTRWVIRHYVYVYFIRFHFVKNKEEKQNKKRSEKQEKEKNKSQKNQNPDDRKSTASGG
ncbi:DUF2953 domain-containing protein [Methanolapillus millepedarum]|uniref:DUF2953 domain-containing protein n=1 Tax=Methanolapillus millepedarum TaxID=3028296 RepID=A0AA96VFL3_9EURY|nr:hypothetical protein MsAc7_12700 [Methanosarcinaceae archaeon Ac7]